MRIWSMGPNSLISSLATSPILHQLHNYPIPILGFQKPQGVSSHALGHSIDAQINLALSFPFLPVVLVNMYVHVSKLLFNRHMYSVHHLILIHTNRSNPL